MVDDGVNDAPALAPPTWVSRWEVRDVDIETADVALMGEDLRHLPQAFNHAPGAADHAAKRRAVRGLDHRVPASAPAHVSADPIMGLNCCYRIPVVEGRRCRVPVRLPASVVCAVERRSSPEGVIAQRKALPPLCRECARTCSDSRYSHDFRTRTRRLSWTYVHPCNDLELQGIQCCEIYTPVVDRSIVRGNQGASRANVVTGEIAASACVSKVPTARPL